MDVTSSKEKMPTLRGLGRRAIALFRTKGLSLNPKRKASRLRGSGFGNVRFGLTGPRKVELGFSGIPLGFLVYSTRVKWLCRGQEAEVLWDCKTLGTPCS